MSVPSYDPATEASFARIADVIVEEFEGDFAVEVAPIVVTAAALALNRIAFRSQSKAEQRRRASEGRGEEALAPDFGLVLRGLAETVDR